jgi:hypothetical protein
MPYASRALRPSRGVDRAILAPIDCGRKPLARQSDAVIGKNRKAAVSAEFIGPPCGQLIRREEIFR